MTVRPLPILDTPRLQLTLPGPEAAAAMVDYFSRNRAHLAPWEPPFTRAMFTEQFWQRRLVQNQTEYRSLQSMRLVVRSSHHQHGPVLGMANFTRFCHGVFMACNLGYSIDATAQGKGLMHEALAAAIQHVFVQLQLHRIMANYIPTNERSGRLLRRLGFQVEGYARDYLFIDGRWRDHILTSITNTQAPIPEYVRMAANEKASLRGGGK